MCGIVGIASSYTNGFSDAECNMLRDMTFVDTLRGWDSTGVFGVTHNGSVELHKAALAGPDFLNTKEYREFRGTLFSRGLFAVAHNRAATRGSVSDENAHPFCIDDKIVLVQNGTYFGSHKHHKDTEVDTEAVAHVIAETDDIAEALRKINAAYALVWYNVATETLHMIRNDQRPLFIANEKDKAGYFFASEDSTIMWAAHRNKIILETPPVLIPPYQLISLKKTKQHFDYSNEVIDAKFRYVAQRAANGHFAPNPRFDLSEDAHSPFVQETGHSTNLRPNKPFKTNPNDIKITLPDILAASEPSTWLPDGVGLPLINKWREEVRGQSRGCVELVDYAATNNHANCTSWWVWGKWCRAESDLDGVVIYWMVNNKNQEEIMNYVSDDYYMADFGFVTYKKFDVASTDFSLITVQGMNPTPVYDAKETPAHAN